VSAVREACDRRAPEAAPTLDIVIVNWNTGPFLERCLASITAAEAGDFRLADVIVVDNASTDASLERAASVPLAVTVIRNAANRGFAAACNQGAAAGRADHVLFLNPDTELLPDTLRRAFACLAEASRHNAGIVGAQMLDGRGERDRSCSRFPTLGMVAAEITGLGRLAPRRFPRRHLEPDETPTSGVVDQVIGAFFLVSRETFDLLGGFDERFFVYFEEVDFAYRARASGRPSFFCSDARVFHEGAVSARKEGRRLYYSLRSRVEYAAEHWPRWQTATLVALTVGVEIPMRLARGAVTGQLRDTARSSLLFGRYLTRRVIRTTRRGECCRGGATLR
jgi:N-acetylglucosaminyl-diphospho-decaprenol L-rhamnosyltransferase